jgi:hypothetical protein
MELNCVPGVCLLASHIALRDLSLVFLLDRMDRESRVTDSGKNDLQRIPPAGTSWLNATKTCIVARPRRFAEIHTPKQSKEHTPCKV